MLWGVAALALAAGGVAGALAAKPKPKPPTHPALEGVWASPEELGALRMRGKLWRSVLAVAEGPLGNANVADQNSNHDVRTLATALAAVRSGRADLRTKASAALLEAIGTEQDARWLAIGRNLGAYAIAADLLALRADGDPASAGTRVQTWLAGFLTRTLRHDNSDVQVKFRRAAWNSGSNASAQSGFAHAAIASYLGNRAELTWAWNGFRRYAGDRSSPHKLRSNDPSWQLRPSDPVGIQDAGAMKDGCRLDGAIANDMSRGGRFRCDRNPRYTQYPWVGLEGAVPAAVVLARAGYPTWAIANRAILRAYEYLWYVWTTTGKEKWFDGERSAETVFLVNRVYGTQFPVSSPTGEGRTVGFTDWTHQPKGASVGPGPAVQSAR